MQILLPFIRSQAEVVIDRDFDLMFGAEIALGGLDRAVAEQEFNLVEVAAALAA